MSISRAFILGLTLVAAGCLSKPSDYVDPHVSATVRTTNADLFEELAWQCEQEHITSGPELVKDAGDALSRAGLSPPARYDELLKPFMDNKKRWDKAEAASVLRSLK